LAGEVTSANSIKSPSQRTKTADENIAAKHLHAVMLADGRKNNPCSMQASAISP